jgi:hypothetical protein
VHPEEEGTLLIGFVAYSLPTAAEDQSHKVVDCSLPHSYYADFVDLQSTVAVVARFALHLH